MLRWIPLAALVACAPDANSPHGHRPSVELPSPPDTDPSPEVDLDELLDDLDFVVQEGAFVFADMSGCCDPEAYCWGNNPATPYGNHVVPGPPGLPPHQPDLYEAFGPIPQGTSREFRLRHDEALVYLGVLPPEAAYVGYSFYLSQRPGTGVMVTAVTGNPLNNTTFEQVHGPAFWGKPIAILTTFEGSIEDEIAAALEASGWPRDQIVFDRIPGEYANPGLGPFSDTFMSLMRVAIYDDPAAEATWLEDTGARVLRLSPRTARPWSRPHPTPELPPRGSGLDEQALSSALDALVAAVPPAFPDLIPTWSAPIPYVRDTAECIANMHGCAGNIHDRYAAVSPHFTLAPGELLVALGVNHARAGKATYSSVSLQTVAREYGLETFTSADMPGSAAAYLPDPAAEDLYLVVFARDCAGIAGTCVEVPLTCPGAAEDEVLKITARAYREPATNAAPMAEELLLDQVVWLRPP